MFSIKNFTPFYLLLFLFIFAIPSWVFATDFDSMIDGDMSKDGLAPTSITLTEGDNSIISFVNRYTDVRYFSVIVPEGYEVQNLFLTKHENGDNVSWFAVMEGDQFTENSINQFDINVGNMLAQSHISGVGTDLFEPLSLTTLPSGTYSFRIQNWGTGVDFGFNFVVAEAEEIVVETVLTANCDAEWQLIDSVLIKQHDALIATASADCDTYTAGQINLSDCDLNEDGSCGLIDAVWIQQCNSLISNPFCP